MTRTEVPVVRKQMVVSAVCVAVRKLLTSSPRLKAGDSTERFTARHPQHSAGAALLGFRGIAAPAGCVTSPAGEEVPS